MFKPITLSDRPSDESTTLPVAAGLAAGLLGTGLVLILVFQMMATIHTDVQIAAHDTLSALLGTDYAPNAFQIITGLSSIWS